MRKEFSLTHPFSFKLRNKSLKVMFAIFAYWAKTNDIQFERFHGKIDGCILSLNCNLIYLEIFWSHISAIHQIALSLFIFDS